MKVKGTYLPNIYKNTVQLTDITETKESVVEYPLVLTIDRLDYWKLHRELLKSKAVYPIW